MLNTSPVVLSQVIASNRNTKAMSKIKTGVARISNAPCIGVLMVNPLIKSNWLMATPVTAHSRKAGISFLSIPALEGFNE